MKFMYPIVLIVSGKFCFKAKKHLTFKFLNFYFLVPFDIHARSGLISVVKTMGSNTLDVYTVKVRLLIYLLKIPKMSPRFYNFCYWFCVYFLLNTTYIRIKYADIASIFMPMSNKNLVDDSAQWPSEMRDHQRNPKEIIVSFKCNLRIPPSRQRK